jgi:hypothetical protein
MEVTLILCDAAQAVDGKLYVLGGGWTLVRAAANDPVTMGLGAIVSIDWNETNQQVEVKVELQTEDGPTVVIGEQPIVLGAMLEVGRPPGVKAGSQMNAALAFPLMPLPLEAGSYVWVLTIDGEEHARRPFAVAR